jgi:CheY-like chemotaxis protein
VKSILLIDDDPIFVYLTRRIIASTNCPCDITEFTDGELALDYLISMSGEPDLLPDVIFLDLSMPVMDGWEFLKEYALLRPRINKEISLYIVSSSISPQEVERSKSYTVVADFLIKPVERGKIVDIMTSVNETTQR